MLKVDKQMKNSLILDSISDRVWEYDILLGETNIVESLVEILGYNKNEISTNIDFFFSLIHTEDIKGLRKAFNEISVGKNEDFNMEYRIRSKDNEYVFINSKGKVLKDEKDKRIYLAGVHLDIRPYKKFQTLFNKVNDIGVLSEVNKKIIDLSPFGVFIINDGIITYANEPGLKLFGAQNKEEVIERPRLDFVSNSYKKRAIKREEIVKNGYNVESVLEMELLKVDGTKIIGEVYSTPISVNNNFLALCFIKDITEQKRIIWENKRLLEQRIEYDRLKNEFFGNISHEIKTPLNIILSAIQLLNSIHNESENNYDDFVLAYEKYIGIMKQNAYRLLKLVTNILDLTKIDAGFSNINLENNNIVEVVEDITLSVTEYIEAKELELIFDTDIEELIIAFDDDKIERIMLNLLSNAIKYNKAGGVIKVDIKKLDTYVMISVQDTGLGIPKDKLNTIFERFRQVDELLTRRAEGSGIGLSLVKSLVEAHGGTISVNSTLGVGSEFVILLPIITVEDSNVSYKSSDILHYDDQQQKKVERISIEFSDIYK